MVAIAAQLTVTARIYNLRASRSSHLKDPRDPRTSLSGPWHNSQQLGLLLLPSSGALQRMSEASHDDLIETIEVVRKLMLVLEQLVRAISHASVRVVHRCSVLVYVVVVTPFVSTTNSEGWGKAGERVTFSSENRDSLFTPLSFLQAATAANLFLDGMRAQGDSFRWSVSALLSPINSEHELWKHDKRGIREQ